MVIAIIISVVIGFVLGYATAYGFGALRNKVKADETIVKDTIKKL